MPNLSRQARKSLVMNKVRELGVTTAELSDHKLGQIYDSGRPSFNGTHVTLDNGSFNKERLLSIKIR